MLTSLVSRTDPGLNLQTQRSVYPLSMSALSTIGLLVDMPLNNDANYTNPNPDFSLLLHKSYTVCKNIPHMTQIMI